MENNNKASEKEIIDTYSKKGYTSSYTIENGKLMDVESKKRYSPNEIQIIAEHRFEGISNPSDMSILYIITTPDQGKGTVLANYSPASSTDMAVFFKEVPKENYKAE